ncbi:JmjC domain-containing histone demethylation protein 1 [Cyberlindnera fabianii]|uniref:[histone H3]-dimethyl-L-lysine(36) demethylase n=1 Tax=Cyberlindnera fabianii TaxID=36022 RepID=A0A1V2L5K9_CYBFA|nr:JmjC domain-containing histone demethylation protein 1 [Cyberlindnera fabianii]
MLKIGNFLTSFNIPEQLKIIDIEIKTKVGKKFKFPNFSKLMWLTAWRVLEGDIEVGETIDAKGCVELLEYLKAQVDRKERGVRQSVPTKYIGNAKSFLKRFEDFVKKNVTVAEVKSEELKEIPTKRRRLNDKTNTLGSDIKTDMTTK